MSRARRGGGAVALAVAATFVGLVCPASAAWADSTRDRQWPLAFLKVAEAQRYSQGAGVIVAVIDSGVDASHPDLAGSVLSGIDAQPGASGNGWTDTDGHGTGMAGLIVAHGHGPGGSLGVVGIAPQAKILPVKDGASAGTAVADGIAWATNHGAKVISISEGSADDDPRERAAVEQAIARDIVVVAGAGNLPGQGVDYPAAYPGVVAVAGVDQHGNHAEVSLTGPQVVLSAPAVDVIRPAVDHGYALGTGTSDATAIDRGPSGRDDVYGYGIVNLVGALTADVPPLATPSASPDPTTGAASSPPTGRSPWLIVGLGVVLVVVAALGLLLVARRRTPG